MAEENLLKNSAWLFDADHRDHLTDDIQFYIYSVSKRFSIKKQEEFEINHHSQKRQKAGLFQKSDNPFEI